VIIGTVTVTLLLTIVGVPLGVLAALYIREYAKQGVLISVLRVAINNLAGVPSIVYGIFGLGFFCYAVGGYIDGGPDVALGKPVVIGAFHSDFQDTVDAMLAAGGIVVTEEPGPVVLDLLEDRNKAEQIADAGRDVIRARQGSTQRHADLILDMLAARKELNPPKGGR